MYANLFFLKYYIAYASVLLSKFRNHPVVFLVIAVCFTTIISVIRSITAYNYLSVLSSLLHSRFSVVTQRSFHRKRLCSRLLFKRRENTFLLCRASFRKSSINFSLPQAIENSRQFLFLRFTLVRLSMA